LGEEPISLMQEMFFFENQRFTFNEGLTPYENEQVC
jgi:hypothetical protein